MGLTSGGKLGPYEILSPLGAGGMGEVYRARDTRLGRDVALKVLAAHLSSDPSFRQRFEREARAISSLNHPYICTLYDVGHQDGTDFLVMEFLEGETLAKRLERGPLPGPELLRIGIGIADALDKAHRQGVIHRDLKPANVMLTKAGAKLLDFGLAKAAATPVAADPSVTPTASHKISGGQITPLTAHGTIMGTMHYMSPEQLEGKEADARSDIFALGATLYEMATGKKAFEGKSQASLIAAILEHEPLPISQLQPLAPPGLERVTKVCLAKDPDERFQSAHDVKLELEWIRDAGSQASVATPVATPRKRRERLAWSAVVVLAIAAALLAVAYLGRAPAPNPALQASLLLPPGCRPTPGDIALALAPDGKSLALVAPGPDGKDHLWLRAMESPKLEPLADTEDASYPFWSPDGRSLGFFATGKLKKLQLSSGAVETLADAPTGRGGTWGADGSVVYAPKAEGGLYAVPANGGAATNVADNKSKPFSYRMPYFLPDGRHVLFSSPSFQATPAASAVPKGCGIFVLDLKTRSIVPLLQEASNAVYAAPGYLLFYRGGNLMAQPFDAAHLRLNGEAVSIAKGVAYNGYRWAAQYSVSQTGLLVCLNGSFAPEAQLTWFALDGKKLATAGPPGAFLDVAISPSGDRALVTKVGENQQMSLWMADLGSGVFSPFELRQVGANSGIWSPDARRVFFMDASDAIFEKPSDGTSEAKQLPSEPDLFSGQVPQAVSPDGRLLLFGTQPASASGFNRIAVQPLAGGGKPYLFSTVAGNEFGPTFSPDGRFLSYLSDQSGTMELYVTAFPGPGATWQVSSGGAMDGGWLGTGRGLMYVTLQQKLVERDVTFHGNEIEFGRPQEIFGGQPLPATWENYLGLRSFAWVTHDAKRLLLPVPVNQPTAAEISLTVNWPALLSRQ